MERRRRIDEALDSQPTIGEAVEEGSEAKSVISVSVGRGDEGDSPSSNTLDRLIEHARILGPEIDDGETIIRQVEEASIAESHIEDVDT